MLKAEVIHETPEELRRAYGFCPPQTPPITWKEIFQVLSQKTIVGEYTDKWSWRYSWIALLQINPRRWKMTINDWVFANRMGKVLAQEIQKEVDAEIIAQITALTRQNWPETATTVESVKKLGKLIGYE